MSDSVRNLVAIVVTYNRVDKLRVTLRRLLESPAEHLSMVLVVDNASTDGTDAWLAEQDDPRLRVERMAENRGGAGGFEHGLRLVHRDHDPDWIVVMDDDGYPMPGALAAFHALDLSEWDAVASAVYYPDGTICDMNRPSRNPFWNGRAFLTTLFGGGREGFHITPEAYEGAPQQIDVTSFVGLFLSRRALKTTGYPDGRLFVYGEDGIYTLGLSAAGGRIGFFPAVRFAHDCSTFGPGEERFRPLWKVYYYHRNLLFLYRIAAGWMFWPALLFIVPKWLLKIRHHRGERRVFLGLMRRAIWDGLLRRTDVSHEQVLAWADTKSTI